MRLVLLSAGGLLLAGGLLALFILRPDIEHSGSRPVGFRVLESTDTSRVTVGFPKGRPIQIAIWYPAASTGKPGKPLAFGDLVRLEARETDFAHRNDDDSVVEKYREFLGQAGVTREQAEAWLATPMKASRDAPPADDRFPLVLIAQGNGESASDQAFLAEILAARGFLVATTPSQARIGGPMKSEEEIPAQSEAQAADLEFARRTLTNDSHVRTGRFGLVAHSFGARSALLVAMHEAEAAALVSLDGGIGTKTGKGLLERAKGFDRDRARAPILHFWEEGDAFMAPDLDLLRSLTRANRWIVKVDGMRHVHFSSVGILVRSAPAIATRTSATDATALAWDAVAESTASFLGRFLSSRGPESGPLSWAPPPSPLLHPVFLEQH